MTRTWSEGWKATEVTASKWLQEGSDNGGHGGSKREGEERKGKRGDGRGRKERGGEKEGERERDLEDSMYTQWITEL